MPIAIDNPLSSSQAAARRNLSAAWPWLISLAMHVFLLVLLLNGLAQLRASHSQEDQFYLVSLLPPHSQTQNANSSMAAVQPALPPNNQLADTALKPRPHSRPHAPRLERQAESQRPAHSPSANAPPAAASSHADAGQGKASLPANGPYTAEQVDQRPRILHHVDPVYPQLARRRGIEGWVEIKFLVTSHGRVSRESVVQAEPEGVFEKSALNALRAWRFQPGMLQGQAVDTWVVQKINFRLAGAS